MKIKSGFLLHSMGDEHVVVPVDDRTKEFAGMIRLNATGAFMWEQFQKDISKEELVEALLAKYEISKEDAQSAVEVFVEKLENAGVLDTAY